MSIEQALAELTAAVKENTAALKAGAGKAGTSTASATTTKPAASSYKPKYKKVDMQALMNKYKEATSVEDARKLISDTLGRTIKMSEIDDAKEVDQIYEAATAAMEALSSGGDEEV